MKIDVDINAIEMASYDDDFEPLLEIISDIMVAAGKPIAERNIQKFLVDHSILEEELESAQKEYQELEEKLEEIESQNDTFVEDLLRIESKEDLGKAISKFLSNIKLKEYKKGQVMLELQAVLETNIVDSEEESIESKTQEWENFRQQEIRAKDMIPKLSDAQKLTIIEFVSPVGIHSGTLRALRKKKIVDDSGTKFTSLGDMIRMHLRKSNG
jgi:hypothetical protein